MAVFSANAVQTVNPGESVIFTNTITPCPYRFVRHRDETGSFLLASGTACRCKEFVQYNVEFGANIGVPTGGTVGEISVGFVLDGTTVPASQMISQAAVVEELDNVSRSMAVDVWANCGCETFAIRNLSDQPILVQNATLSINRVR